MNYCCCFQTKFAIVWNESFGNNILINDLAITLFLILDFNANVINAMKITFFSCKAIIQRKKNWKNIKLLLPLIWNNESIQVCIFIYLVLQYRGQHNLYYLNFESNYLDADKKKIEIKHQEQIGNVVKLLWIFCYQITLNYKHGKC